MLRVVGAMVCGAGCYLAAFTATSACGNGDGCARAAWHHVTAAAELLLLAAGARIAYAARNANVPFQVLQKKQILQSETKYGAKLAKTALHDKQNRLNYCMVVKFCFYSWYTYWQVITCVYKRQ